MIIVRKEFRASANDSTLSSPRSLRIFHLFLSDHYLQMAVTSVIVPLPCTGCHLYRSPADICPPGFIPITKSTIKSYRYQLLPP